MVYNLWQCMKWHELNHVIGNTPSQFHGGQSLVSVEKFHFANGEYSAKLYIIFNGKVLPTQYNDLLRQITSSSSSSRRSLFFDWQQYIAGVVSLLFVLYKMLYSIAFVSPFFVLSKPSRCSTTSAAAYFILKHFRSQVSFLNRVCRVVLCRIFKVFCTTKIETVWDFLCFWIAKINWCCEVVFRLVWKTFAWEFTLHSLKMV